MSATPKAPPREGGEHPVRLRLLALGMKLSELSGLTGLDGALLSRIASGQREASIETRMKIARALGQDVHVLFPREGR